MTMQSGIDEAMGMSGTGQRRRWFEKKEAEKVS